MFLLWFFFSKGGERVQDKGPIALFLCPRGSAKLVWLLKWRGMGSRWDGQLGLIHYVIHEPGFFFWRPEQNQLCRARLAAYVALKFPLQRVLKKEILVEALLLPSLPMCAQRSEANCGPLSILVEWVRAGTGVRELFTITAWNAASFCPCLCQQSRWMLQWEVCWEKL